MKIMTPEERVKRAWAKVTFGPGWERRLSMLMADEIREAVAEALARAVAPTAAISETSSTPTTS